MAKASKKAAPKTIPPPPDLIKALAAMKARAAVRAQGPTGWKDNKYGYTAASVSCYTCAWYEPVFGPGHQAPQQQPNGPGGNGPSVRNNNNNQEVNPDAASQYGWCRGDSVEQQNLNAENNLGENIGWFLSSFYWTPSFPMNEVIVKDATEFWCGMWTRSRNPFAFPPNYSDLPQPWQPQPPPPPVP